MVKMFATQFLMTYLITERFSRKFVVFLKSFISWSLGRNIQYKSWHEYVFLTHPAYSFVNLFVEFDIHK